MRDEISAVNTRMDNRRSELLSIRARQMSVQESIQTLNASAGNSSSSRGGQAQTAAFLQSQRMSRGRRRRPSSRGSSNTSSSSENNNRDLFRPQSALTDEYLQTVVRRHMRTPTTSERRRVGSNFLSVGQWNSELSNVQHLDNDPSRAGMRQFLSQVFSSPNKPKGLSLSKIRRLGSFKSKDDRVDPCCICLEKINMGDEIVALVCAHTFHQRCIRKWLEVNGKCPLCKISVE